MGGRVVTNAEASAWFFHAFTGVAMILAAFFGMRKSVRGKPGRVNFLKGQKAVAKIF
jgi:hypothetical protein